MNIKFIKLTSFTKDIKSLLVNMNDITFVVDYGEYRKVSVKLNDRIQDFKVTDSIDTIYSTIEAYKNTEFKPLYD